MRKITDSMWVVLSLCVLANCGSPALTLADYPDACNTLVADLSSGTLSGAPPTISYEQAQAHFGACKTGATPEGSPINCGGGVFFLGKQFFLYTHRDYIELRQGFEGQFVGGIDFASDRQVVKATYGIPSLQPDVDTDLYETRYGTLRIEYRFGEISIIAMHSVPPEVVELCR